MEQQSEKLVERPFDVRVNDATHDRFYDVRDALAGAQTLKRENPSAVVIVTDTRTGKLLIEITDL